MRGDFAGRLDRSVEAVAIAAFSAATMGRVLAGAFAVGGVAARPVLVGASAGPPQGHALGPGAFRGSSPIACSRRPPGCDAGGMALHREWFERTRLADLLGGDFGLAEIHKLCRCHDRLLEHKEVLFDHLTERWRDLFNARFDLLLYDPTSTYFEAEPPFADGDKRRFGYSRDRRHDCVQVVIALVVTPEGLPLAYEVLSGNTSDKTTLRDFLARIERQYGKARRVWLMDRGIPTEEVLAEMRQADPPVQYLVGTPKGRLNRLERDLLGEPRRAGQAVAEGGRTLRLRPEPRQGRQGARNAQATIERAVGAAERPAPDVGQPVARRTAHQTRTSQSQGAGRMAPGRSRRRPGARRVRLFGATTSNSSKSR